MGEEKEINRMDIFLLLIKKKKNKSFNVGKIWKENASTRLPSPTFHTRSVKKVAEDIQDNASFQ